MEREERDGAIHCVRQAGDGGWSWSGVREKHCYFVWWLEAGAEAM